METVKCVEEVAFSYQLSLLQKMNSALALASKVTEHFRGETILIPSVFRWCSESTNAVFCAVSLLLNTEKIGRATSNS